ncbi:MAG: hypothetical protein NTV21_11480 [Planctomycetota bacterium]|nr:hypothetical protein [Planctomycetota bacterium]
MKPAPERIGGARVLSWSTIGRRRDPEEAPLGPVVGEVQRSVVGIAICRYDGEVGVFLFGCDEEWNSRTDSWHSTFQEAVRQAEFEHKGVDLKWTARTREGTFPLELAKLSPESRQFATRLFAAVPQAEPCSRMEGRAHADLLVEIPSPTGDPDRRLVIWMEGGDEPSVGFGEWHTHDGLWGGDDAMVELVKAILADQFVLAHDIGGTHPGSCGGLDLRDPNALVEELTSRHSPGRVRLWTWSGRGDREVGLQDLELGSPLLESMKTLPTELDRRRAREITLEIRTILLRDWDPIEVGEVPEGQDEYDGYVGRVYRLLTSRPSREEVVEYLRQVESTRMGLHAGPERLRRIAEVAEKLLAVDLRLNRD